MCDKILILNCRFSGVILGYLTTGNMTFVSVFNFSGDLEITSGTSGRYGLSFTSNDSEGDLIGEHYFERNLLGVFSISMLLLVDSCFNEFVYVESRIAPF